MSEASSELDSEELAAHLAEQLQGKLSRKKLIELAVQAKRLQERLALTGPQDRDQLHAWIKHNLKLDIPRVAVCEGHTSPFEFIALVYFEEEMNVTAIANRGGSKTFGVAVLHLLNSRFKPRTDSLTVGAVENQARRCVSGDTLVDCPRDVKEWPNGVPIKKLRSGQFVWSYNVLKGKPELKRISNIGVTRRNAEVVRLYLSNGEELVVTPDHRMLRANGKYEQAKRLTTSDRLMSRCGTEVTVEFAEDAGIEDTWCMDVEDNENFFSGGVVLHNCYTHMQKLIDTIDPKHAELAKDPTQTETRWSNGSTVEILPGTMNAVNGPHPQKLHLDEVELFDPEVLEEAANMPQAKELASGRISEAQIIRTSTRKRATGMMQQIVDEANEAKLQGKKPQTHVLTWCVFETARRVPNCQVAYPDQTCEGCNCHDVVKGTWDDGSPRTLRDVCQGKLARSNGWITFTTIQTTFTSVSRAVWEAQQECKRPSTQGLVVPQFARERNVVMDYDPDPDNGPIFMSVDFGGTNPHAVNWYQLTKHELVGKNVNGYELRIPEGSLVAFDEIYRAEIGNARLATLIVEREKAWRERHSSFRVLHRFYDTQSKVGKLDFAQHVPPLRLQNFVPKDVREEVKLVVERVDDGKLFVDGSRCVNWIDEIESWHYPKKRAGMVDDPDKPVDDFDHCMSALRYLISNLRHVAKMQGKRRPAPRSSGEGSEKQRSMITVPRSAGPSRGTDAWRSRTIRPLGS